MSVMPANAGIHVALVQGAKMDARVRGHDDRKDSATRGVIPRWSKSRLLDVHHQRLRLLQEVALHKVHAAGKQQ
jgi:hypothetical protein